MYKIYVGNPFEIFVEGDVICVTTNGEIKKDKRAVMGKGIAKFFRDTFKDVDLLLGKYLKLFGNRAFMLGEYQYGNKMVKLATFPTKHTWRGKSDLNLIAASAKQIKGMADKYEWSKIYIPIPGCSNGQLNWSQVKEVLNNLDERFVIFSLHKDDFEK